MWMFEKLLVKIEKISFNSKIHNNFCINWYECS